MSALTLVIATPDNTRRKTAGRRMARNAGGVAPLLQPETALLSAQADSRGDIVLAMLARARSIIDRIAVKRQASNVARNRVETRRELAKLPARVRDDLLPAERQTGDGL